ncbi:MAG TPA: TetR/AcrR family transcriptional regulator [Pseudonocardiaceae bacterium]
MSTKARILEAATELLSTSVDGDVSTRAVCEAAGVGAPALYRQFGDKEGLLAAVVDHAFESFLASKRALAETGDPVHDLYAGWANHMAFALANPHHYRLMYGPGLATRSAAAAEAHDLLLAVLHRCAEAGRLRVAPELAASVITACNTGAAMALICRPELHPDPAFADRIRDAVLASVVATSAPAAPALLADAAITFQARLATQPPAELTEQETGLLHEWLDRLTAA